MVATNRSMFGDPDGVITGSQIKLSAGGLRFDREITAGWQISPSLGLVAGDVHRFGLAIQSLREPVIKSITDVMIPSIRRNFDEEGRPSWEPLSDITVKLRGTAHPILKASGALERGVTQISIWRIGEESATIQSLPQSIWYGALHQSGYGTFGKYVEAAKKELGKGARPSQVTKLAFELMDEARGAKKQSKIVIPRRRFLMFQDDDIDDIMQIFAEWLEDKAREVGRFTGRTVRTSWGGPSL